MLRVALLGRDDEAVELTRTAHGSKDMAVTSLVCTFPIEGVAARTEDSWEGLLHDHSIDAVIVGRDGIPNREDALRKLVQIGKPLLLTIPPCVPLFSFELEMNRREGEAPILIHHPDVVHPLFRRFAEWCHQVGSIEYAAIERQLTSCSRETVRNQFSADVAILRRVLGRLTKISATGTGPEVTEESNLAIAVENEQRAVGRWSVAPGAESARIKVRAASGQQVQLNIQPNPSEWSLELPDGRELRVDDVPKSGSATEETLQLFSSAVNDPETAEPWDHICRDLEAVDMIDHSARRGRTVELYGSEVSERGTFKGVMAAGGCFLLLISFFVLLIVAAVEGLRPPFRDHILWRIWPLYLLVPIVIFLVMQLLQLAIKKPSET